MLVLLLSFEERLLLTLPQLVELLPVFGEGVLEELETPASEAKPLLTGGDAEGVGDFVLFMLFVTIAFLPLSFRTLLASLAVAGALELLNPVRLSSELELEGSSRFPWANISS